MECKEFSLDNVRNCILSAIRKNETFLFNELDLQMYVAEKLRKQFKCNIHFEYRLPDEWNDDFQKGYEAWGETPYFDLVLEDDGQFIAIELKYKLKEVLYKKDHPFTRFGVSPSKGEFPLVTDHSAENEGRYDFWKDVKRLELLTECFDNVKGGVAVFLTNQQRYTKETKGYKYSNFCFTDKNVSGFLYWKRQKCINGRSKCDGQCEGTPCGEKKKDIPKRYKGKDWNKKYQSYTRPNFRLNKQYNGVWLPEKENGDGKKGFKGGLDETFYCYHVTIPQSR